MLVREFQRTKEKQTGSKWNCKNRTLQKVTGQTGRSLKGFSWLSGAAAALLTAGSVLPDWIQMWRKDERRLKTERREGKRNIFLRSYWCNLKKQLQVDVKREPRINCWKPKSDDFWKLEGNCWVMLKCLQDFLNKGDSSSWSTIFPKRKGKHPGWKTAAYMDLRFPKANMFPWDRAYDHTAACLHSWCHQGSFGFLQLLLNFGLIPDSNETLIEASIQVTLAHGSMKTC